MGDDLEVYDTKAAVADAAKMGLITGGVGLFISTVQNALSSHNRGALGIFTRTGGTIGIFAVIGATYAFTESFVANTRSKDDAINSFAGGCAAGMIWGAKAGSIPAGLASCAVLGGFMGTFQATGASLTGNRWQSQSLQSVEERRKQFFKQRPPQPLPMPSETS